MDQYKRSVTIVVLHLVTVTQVTKNKQGLKWDLSSKVDLKID